MIVKTPLRVSLFGGGSDIPKHFEQFQGHVLGFTINKFIHNVAIKIKFDQGYKYRLSYRVNEEVQKTGEINHPIYKVLLDQYSIKGSWHFLSITDIPSGSGLGSSSTFTVGLIKLLRKILSKDLDDPRKIATEAINIERNILQESGGWQDQIHAAYTGVNSISFEGNTFNVSPVNIKSKNLDLLNNSIYIVFSGKTRDSSSIESTKNVNSMSQTLQEMVKVSKAGEKEIASENLDLGIIGELLEENWRLKKMLSSSVSSSSLNELHNTIMKSGAYGAKLCGAGGGGFFFVIADSNAINNLKHKFGSDIIIEKIEISFFEDEYIRDSL